MSANAEAAEGLVVRDMAVGPEGARRFVRAWMPHPEGSHVGLPPLVLFHESLGCVSLWKRFPERLARETGRRVIAYDRLGFGRSDPLDRRPGFDFIAREGVGSVPLLQEALGFTRFVACGHSVGGCMAVETAARLREHCAGLVTLAAQSFAEERTLVGIRQAEQTFLEEANLARLARHHGDKARFVVEFWTRTWLDPAFAGWTLDEAIASAGCPVLAVHGDADQYGSPDHARRIAGDRGDLLLMKGAGHILHREREAEVVTAIAVFLARNGI
uniref:alpha/beta fold hydrolase n=1 Tax=Stappia sp. TaxID=1870903 RepID=UPI003BA8F95D